MSSWLTVITILLFIGESGEVPVETLVGLADERTVEAPGAVPDLSPATSKTLYWGPVCRAESR